MTCLFCWRWRNLFPFSDPPPHKCMFDEQAAAPESPSAA